MIVKPSAGPSHFSSRAIDDLSYMGSISDKMEAQKSTLSTLEGEGKEHEDEKRSAPEEHRDPEGVLLKFIEHLLSPNYQDSDPNLMAIGYELEALLSIYTPSSVKLNLPSRPPSLISLSTNNANEASSLEGNVGMSTGSAKMERRINSQQYTDAIWDFETIGFTPGERIRYEITIPIWEKGESLEGLDNSTTNVDVQDNPPIMRVLVSLPPTYPNSSPPQLQLLGRYLGNFGIDSGLFGDITRTYISSTGVAFVPGDVCVFEGLTHVQSVVRQWYISHLNSLSENDSLREAEKASAKAATTTEQHHLIRGMSTLDISNNSNHNSEFPDYSPEKEGSIGMDRPELSRSIFSYSIPDDQDPAQKDGTANNLMNSFTPDISKLKIHTSDPIIDRKSTFIGQAVKVTDEKEIPLIIHELLSDKKISKAAHPAIFAYRLVRDVGGQAGKVYNTDYDDDGETAAGSRLKHLLEILELENVLVVVTRWYGGIHLGPDRFKHINQAARDALEIGGFLADKKDDTSGAKRRGGKK
ncbi:uncharacterized protein IL334_001946 [Kwoniella shivajii]|uniref:RWD domain-containing protein n=1 Tax=Kwoniella shivajii TaxID=564305 RepID=A0ABZ1CTC1_9TREE|nr:hypothetical protein IL334_001946 [Kwoniella shivajii]